MFPPTPMLPWFMVIAPVAWPAAVDAGETGWVAERQVGVGNQFQIGRHWEIDGRLSSCAT